MSKGKRLRNARSAKNVGPHTPVVRVRQYGRGEHEGVAREVSDRRTVDVTGICALCRKDGPLELGHVWPRWSGRWARAEGGFQEFRSDVEGHTFGQDSKKHYLLCTSCERLLGDGENRLRLLSAGTPREFASGNLSLDQIGPTEFRVGESERTLISRALLGIALKAHFAPSVANRIKPDNLIDKIRSHILSGRYADMHVLGAKWYSRDRDLNPRAYAGFAAIRVFSGGTVLYIALAGFDWWVSLYPFHDFADGRSDWLIELHPIEMRASWFDDWERLSESVGDELPQASPGEMCPCGSLRGFEQCCERFWYSQVPWHSESEAES